MQDSKPSATPQPKLIARLGVCAFEFPDRTFRSDWHLRRGLLLSEPASISSGIASRYATAVFSLAKEEKKLKQLEADVDDLDEALTVSSDLRSLVTSPLYTRAEMGQAIEAGSSVNEAAAYYGKYASSDGIKTPSVCNAKLVGCVEDSDFRRKRSSNC